jgi:hypothetical protein
MARAVFPYQFVQLRLWARKMRANDYLGIKMRNVLALPLEAT